MWKQCKGFRSGCFQLRRWQMSSHFKWGRSITARTLPVMSRRKGQCPPFVRTEGMSWSVAWPLLWLWSTIDFSQSNTPRPHRRFRKCTLVLYINHTVRNFVHIQDSHTVISPGRTLTCLRNVIVTQTTLHSTRAGLEDTIPTTPKVNLSCMHGTNVVDIVPARS